MRRLPRPTFHHSVTPVLISDSDKEQNLLSFSTTKEFNAPSSSFLPKKTLRSLEVQADLKERSLLGDKVLPTIIYNQPIVYADNGSMVSGSTYQPPSKSQPEAITDTQKDETSSPQFIDAQTPKITAITPISDSPTSEESSPNTSSQSTDISSQDTTNAPVTTTTRSYSNPGATNTENSSTTQKTSTPSSSSNPSSTSDSSPQTATNEPSSAPTSSSGETNSAPSGSGTSSQTYSNPASSSSTQTSSTPTSSSDETSSAPSGSGTSSQTYSNPAASPSNQASSTPTSSSGETSSTPSGSGTSSQTYSNPTTSSSNQPSSTSSGSTTSNQPAYSGASSSSNSGPTTSTAQSTSNGSPQQSSKTSTGNSSSGNTQQSSGNTQKSTETSGSSTGNTQTSTKTSSGAAGTTGTSGNTGTTTTSTTTTTGSQQQAASNSGDQQNIEAEFMLDDGFDPVTGAYVEIDPNALLGPYEMTAEEDAGAQSWGEIIFVNFLVFGSLGFLIWFMYLTYKRRLQEMIDQRAINPEAEFIKAKELNVEEKQHLQSWLFNNRPGEHKVDGVKVKKSTTPLGSYFNVDFSPQSTSGLGFGEIKTIISNHGLDQYRENCYFELEIEELLGGAEVVIGLSVEEAHNPKALPGMDLNHPNRSIGLSSNGLCRRNGVVVNDYKFTAQYGETLGIGYNFAESRVYLFYNGKYLNDMPRSPSPTKTLKELEMTNQPIKKKGSQPASNYQSGSTPKGSKSGTPKAGGTPKALKTSKASKKSQGSNPPTPTNTLKTGEDKEVHIIELAKGEKYFPVIGTNGKCRVILNIGGAPFRIHHKAIAQGLL